MRKLAEDTMTARERVEAAINYQNPDRVPIFDLIQHIPLIEYCTGQKITLENGLDLLCQTIRENLDITRGVTPPQEEKIIKYSDGFVVKCEWWTTWIIERPFKDVEGTKEYIKRNIDYLNSMEHPGQVMWFTDDREGFAETSGLAITIGDHFRMLQEKLGDTVLFHPESPVGLDIAYHKTGLELFCYTYADYPELVSEWLETLCQNEIRRVDEIADPSLSPVALVFADQADKNGTIFSPAFLRKEFFPRLKKVVEAWHKHGVKVIFHSDGNLLEVLDDFVASGIDGINPLDPLWNMTASSVHDRYPRLPMMGGIDATALLPFGSEEDIEKAVKETIDVVSPEGGLIIGSTTEIHPACKMENVLKLWDTAISYGRYNR